MWVSNRNGKVRLRTAHIRSRGKHIPTTALLLSLLKQRFYETDSSRFRVIFAVLILMYEHMCLGCIVTSGIDVRLRHRLRRHMNDALLRHKAL
jgi:hypothetical protein